VKEYNEKTFRKGLKKNEDYIIINKELWYFLIDNYGGGPEIALNKNDDIYSSTSVIITEDLFFSRYQKKPSVSESDMTNQYFNESIVTNNFEMKQETKFGDTQIMNNNKDYLHHTILNYTNYDDNDNGTVANASKFEETLYFNDMENSKVYNFEANKGIVFKQTPKPNKKKEEQMSDKLKTILNLKN